jgi:hypothetical protein
MSTFVEVTKQGGMHVYSDVFRTSRTSVPRNNIRCSVYFLILFEKMILVILELSIRFSSLLLYISVLLCIS